MLETSELHAEDAGPALIVGLGNPGIEYQFTPHNAGFLAIDRLAEESGARVDNRRCRALTAKTMLAGFPVVLAKPETYMNLSGLAVRALVDELRPGNLIVIYDDLDLELGNLRIRKRGSSGGHNGAKSISGALGTEEWLRIRIGIGPAGDTARSRARNATKEYVLAPWKKAQLEVLSDALDRVRDATETILRDGADAAMSKFNRHNGAGNSDANEPND